MDLLFAGLIALGVAVTVVVILKSLCFLSECLSTRCNHQMRSLMPLNYSQAVASARPVPRITSSDVQQLGGIQRYPERLYVICVDSAMNPPKFVVNRAPLETNGLDVESPPTYEEAMSLIDPSINPDCNPCHSS
jgi:hypothetical protein